MSTKVYNGSCHCGDVKYQIRLTLPPATEIGPDLEDSTKIYKCNCSICHKMGMFHCRPSNPPQDFILTSPADPKDLSEYRYATKSVKWYFCKHCGVRTIALAGEWVPEEIDVAKWAEREGHGNTQKVFKTVAMADGTISPFNGKAFHYLSVNATTLDDIDLIGACDKGWVYYVENKDRKDGEMIQRRFKQPFEGGCY